MGGRGSERQRENPRPPYLRRSMSQWPWQTKLRTSYAGRIIAGDPFFRFSRTMMSSHPNRFEISLCQPRPPLPRGDPSSTRPIKGVCARVCGLLGRGQTRGRAFREGEGCMWDSARMMLNAQKCNCIVERKNPPRDVDGTIMGPIIILSTPQG